MRRGRCWHVAPLQPHSNPAECTATSTQPHWVFLNGGDRPTAADAGCKVRDPLTYGRTVEHFAEYECTGRRGVPADHWHWQLDEPRRPRRWKFRAMAPHHRRITCLRLVRTYYSVVRVLHFFSFRSTQVVAVAARGFFSWRNF